MEFKGLKLDKFQEDSIKAIENNHSVVVSAPTGSGKTLTADYVINRDVKKGVRVIYTAPIKALSNQKYKDFVKDYGKEKVGIMTGDIVINPNAEVLVMTTEIYRNMILTEDPSIQNVSYVIFDEIHYINDPERGYVWEESIIFSPPHVRFLCLSATIPNAEEFADWIHAIKEHEVEVIRHEIRSVPLKQEFFDKELGLTTLNKIKELDRIPEYRMMRRGKKTVKRRVNYVPDHRDLIKKIRDRLPCIFFTFSRAGCEKKTAELLSKQFFTYDANVTSFIVKKLSKSPTEISKLKTTRLLRESLPYGIGFHHAGLLPILKDVVEELFAMGKIKVLYATETFAVGINMPAKTVCFDSLRKFDGIEFRYLNSKEFFQIAGRAGRRGIDTEGFVVAMIQRPLMEPEKISKMVSKDIMPIKSQFKLSVNTVLNLIKNHNDMEIDAILKMSFYSFQKYGKRYNKEPYHMMHRVFNNTKKKLKKLHYIENDILTKKGEFAANIYADEIIFSEIFATELLADLDEYEMLLLISVLVFEDPDRVEFHKTFDKKIAKKIRNKIMFNPVLRNDKRFENLEAMTAFAKPIFEGNDFFAMLKNSNLPEGDLMRFLRRVVDRLDQIKRATKDKNLSDVMDGLKKQIIFCLEDIDIL